MLETSRAYLVKFDKVVVPMAKGDRSRVVLDLAFSLSKEYNSEITALTVKEELKEVTWSDKVNVIINAYRDGKERNIRVIPKVRTSRSVRQGIVDEVKSKSYDLLLLGTFKRSLLSASIFGGIGDFVIKNSPIPTAVMSIKGSSYPYRRILVPVCETLNTRSSVSLALHIKKALGSDLVFADLRKYDKKRTHGFHTLFDSLGETISLYGENITVLRPGLSRTLMDEMDLITSEQKPDMVVLGLAESRGGKVRFNSAMKSIIKSNGQDTIVLKK